MRTMNILGVRIDNVSRKEILTKVESFLGEEGLHQIATVNPEFVLEAQKNAVFRDILNGCDLTVPEGVGIAWAFMRYGKRLRCRLPGADLVQEILAIASRDGIGVFLACSSKGLSSYEEIREVLVKKYPGVIFGGDTIDPKRVDAYGIPARNASRTEAGGRDMRYEILLCNFGAPAQEVFINSLKDGTIRLAMGVGGAFDFLTEKRSRAPRLLRRMGLEWLWRLMLEPRYRCKRVLRAVVIFPIKLFISNVNE